MLIRSDHILLMQISQNLDIKYINMKPIIIDIKKLGAIQNSKIEIKPFMVISGDSGLGKSYLAILIHFVYKIITEEELSGFFIEHGWTTDSLLKESEISSSISFPAKLLFDWINKTAVEYLIKATGNPELSPSFSIDFPLSEENINISFITEKVEINDKEETFTIISLSKHHIKFKGQSSNFGALPLQILLSEWLKEKIFERSSLQQTCILVPGRGALLVSPHSLQDELAKQFGLIAEFIKDWRIILDMHPQGEPDLSLLYKLSLINGGEISIDENKQLRFKINDNEDNTIPISATASSVKELTPLVILLKKFPVKGLSILFEEPEAHLHPSKQFEIADLIVEMVNLGAHLQITTHSDYFIRRINDRIILNKIKQINELKYKELCEKYRYSDCSLDERNLGAYILVSGESGDVEIIEQTIGDEGIPYTTFNDALRTNLPNSVSLIRELLKLKSNVK